MISRGSEWRSTEICTESLVGAQSLFPGLSMMFIVWLFDGCCEVGSPGGR
jgi:hypothetical protein